MRRNCYTVRDYGKKRDREIKRAKRDNEDRGEAVMTSVLGRREAGYRSEGMERAGGGRRSEMKHDTSEPPESLAIGFMMDPAIVEGLGISRHNNALVRHIFKNVNRNLDLTQEER